jgi:hypothetical protein
MYSRQMPVDASLLEQAKAAERRVLDAELVTEAERCEFHRAVRRLQLAGASFREIADAMGLSHQRVHQIVKAAGGSRRWRNRLIPVGELRSCSFCGRNQKQVKTLVAGPDVFICDKCVPRTDAVLTTGSPATTRAAVIERVGEDDRAERCGFCGKHRQDVAAMAAAGEFRICSECLGLCREILAERLG